ncbi:MEDS domain-containing protein [Actinoallomurus soli]|uniref:MEDS domain-containing protein n=1 Tax=Actinoallomurus soli TaxID=2952535 RepID=UPI002093B845|nr:MEDS domain-containing protein [Actinoallomurus soli]MCO5971488.1 MEDS domain-containing protein [Actinoallomurus soli]
MESWFTRRSVGELLPGDHAWLSYHGREEHDHVIGAFLRDGLAGADKVIYIADDGRAELPDLRSRYRLEPETYLRSGQLAILPQEETCLTRGVFDPARMTTTLREVLDRAETERFRGVRVTVDMTSAFRRGSGRDGVLECEARVEAAISPSTMAMAICQVDARSCTTEELIALKERHEVLVGADPYFDDGVLSITPTFHPRGLRLSGELDGARHAVFAESLRKVVDRGGEVHLDLAGLRFIDLGALSMMAGAAMHLDARVVLDNPSNELADVVELVSSRLLPWLEIGDGEAR